MGRPKMHEVMRTEVIADCYGGDTCDQMDSDTHREDITIRLADLPAGAVVSVSYPCCPECGSPREDEMESLGGGRMKIIGHKVGCHCGFDWNNWIAEQYS